MKFRKFEVAEVSTANITEHDGHLLNMMDRNKIPYCLAEIFAEVGNGSYGHYFYVPVDKWADGTDSFDEMDKEVMIERLKDAGFSQEFINLFVELQKQGIPYVRIDRDVELVEGAPTFEW